MSFHSFAGRITAPLASTGTSPWAWVSTETAATSAGFFPPSTVPTAAPGAVFPKAVDPKYASESAGKARMHTCLDQYKANTGAGNGGLKWIEKGGGYYSACNKRLKG